MPDIFETIVEQVISKSFNDALSKERQKGIRLIGKSWDFYNGNQVPYIRKHEGEDFDEFLDKDKPTFNYTKLIIDEYVSGVFGKPVIVEFEDRKETERWNEIVSPLSFVNQLPFMKKVQRIAEVSETAVVMVRYDKEKKMPFFEDIRGEFVHFVPKEENPKETGVIVISYLYDTGIPDPRLRYMQRIELWDEEKWEVWVHSETMKSSQKIDGGENPYGIIPCVSFKPEEDDNSFYGTSATRDIVIINETYNNLWVALTRVSVMQSFSVLVITSDTEIKMTVAPTRFLKLPETDKAKAEYITPNAKIEEVRKVLLSLKDDLQDFSRVPASVFSSTSTKGAPQSGYALKIKRIPIEEVWENRRQSYGPSYARLAAMALHVDDVHKGKATNDRREMDDLPDVLFTSTVPGLSPQEQLVQDQFELRYNIITPVDLYLRKFPGTERETAIKELKKNREENAVLGATATMPLQDVEGNDAVLRELMNEKKEQKKAEAGEKEGVETPTGGETEK